MKKTSLKAKKAIKEVSLDKLEEVGGGYCGEYYSAPRYYSSGCYTSRPRYSCAPRRYSYC